MTWQGTTHTSTFFYDLKGPKSIFCPNHRCMITFNHCENKLFCMRVSHETMITMLFNTKRVWKFNPQENRGWNVFQGQMATTLWREKNKSKRRI